MLKKCLFYYIIFCLLIISTVIVPNKKLVFADVVTNSSYYTFYCAGKISGDFINCEIIDVGYGSIVTTDIINAEKLKKQIGNIQGESFVAKNSNVNFCYDIISHFDALIVKQEQIDNVMLIYAYSQRLENFVIDNDKKINLQFALVGETLTVGYPLIMGSY